ncbi:MAG TPA: DNA cytosine methyltransferase [Gaiellaceae bacterium]|nr:DNA cytosine methyltransferase [Gaiellaceae bacterium]
MTAQMIGGGEPHEQILDLFAGPGGWDVAAKDLGLDPLGVELDESACATREAAGLRTQRADVAQLDPATFAPVTGLIASPPCPTFSTAGKRAGALLTQNLVEAMRDLVAGRDTRAAHAETARELLERAAPDEKATARAASDARMSMLIVEPLRFALTLQPKWIALEQVPPVLPLWRELARMFGTLGYSTWTGLLEAERYGVPQTRERAFLLARADGAVARPPKPTHQRYIKGQSARHDHTFDGEILPWTSMADALNWPPSGAAGWTHGRPAPTITGGSARCDGGALVYPTFRASSAPNACRRSAAEPAPTIMFGNSVNDVRWVYERPATTVQCDSRLAPPGHKGDRKREPNARRQFDNAVQVTLEEAAVLQSFPADYPWQGTKTKRFQQVGNAVPPRLARAVLASLLD